MAMRVKKVFSRFLRDENATVTVDWVVISAALAMMTVILIIGLVAAIDNTYSGIFDTVLEAVFGPADQ